MKFKCRFCGARFEYESNIRSHADMYHAEIVEQIMYRQYVEYLERQQASETFSSGSSPKNSIWNYKTVCLTVIFIRNDISINNISNKYESGNVFGFNFKVNQFPDIFQKMYFSSIIAPKKKLVQFQEYEYHKQQILEHHKRLR